MYVLVNGHFVAYEDACVSVEDRGFQFGDGVYEVARVVNGRIFALAEHIERMLAGAAEIEIPAPYDYGQINDLLSQTVKKNALHDGIIYWQLTRGCAPRVHRFPEAPKPTFVAYTREFLADETLWETGVKASIQPDKRWLMCHVKTINLLPNCLAKEIAARQGCYEALLEREGYGVVEAGSSNLFIVMEGVLQTPPLSHLILPGITRAQVLEMARRLKIPVEQTYFERDRLLAADEVFITSTGVEVMGVVQVDGATIGEGRPGPITRKLHQALRTLMTG